MPKLKLKLDIMDDYSRQPIPNRKIACEFESDIFFYRIILRLELGKYAYQFQCHIGGHIEKSFAHGSIYCYDSENESFNSAIIKMRDVLVQNLGKKKADTYIAELNLIK